MGHINKDSRFIRLVKRQYDVLSCVRASPGNGPNTGLPVPMPAMREKKRRERLMCKASSQQNWVVGHPDEVWFSRYATPHLHIWTEGKALALELKTPSQSKTVPKALACYGILRKDTGEMLLRFVEGRPVSGVTTQFLQWLLDLLGAQGKQVFVMFWDNASWHVSWEVQKWIKEHNGRVKGKGKGGCRLLACR